MALHRGLTDAQKRGLFSLLTGVDAQTTIISSADPRIPEVVRPIGVATTTRDTGAPFANFFQSGVNTNVLMVTGGIIAVIALFSLLR